MSCLHEFSLRMHTYIGLQACFARKQTMLAGYEDSMLCSHVRPVCGRTLSRPPAVCGCTLSRRASLQGRPAAVPFPASGHVSADFVFIFGQFLPNLKNEISPQRFNFRNKITQLYAKWGKIVSHGKKSRSPIGRGGPN